MSRSGPSRVRQKTIGQVATRIVKRETACAAALCGLAALTICEPASAHGLGARADLPLPGWLFGWAAAIVLTLSFVGLGILWQTPRLQTSKQRVLTRIPNWVDPLCGAVGVCLFVGLVVVGFAGTQNPNENALPTFVFVIFWVALPLTCVALGDVFRPFNPWRACARFCVWLGMKGMGWRYPDKLGHWPAVISLIGFGWLELIATDKDSPQLLASLALGYAAIQMLTMFAFGVERVGSRADAFGVYFGILARVSPFSVQDRQLFLRAPLANLTQIKWRAGTVALLCSGLGITAFDGASQGPLWIEIAGFGQRMLMHAGLSATLALQLVSTVGLLGMIGLVASFYLLGIVGMRSVDRNRPRRELRTLFAHSLVPIAVAYVIAHYFSMLVFQGQAVAYLVSDPFGHGANIFGTASIAINYGLMSATTIWYLQVAALVAGHVCGLTLAHDKALVLYGRARTAVQSQYWMLVVMVGFTSLGLWLLSQANS